MSGLPDLILLLAVANIVHQHTTPLKCSTLRSNNALKNVLQSTLLLFELTNAYRVCSTLGQQV